MGLHEALKKELEHKMVHVEAYMRDYLAYLQLPQPMRTILQELLSAPGKQLRPMLTLLAAEALHADTAQTDRVCRLGALLEIVHMASLVHDDVVDDAPLRRGLPTTQGVYGKNIAVYTGDFLLSRVLSALLTEQMNRSGEVIAKAVEAMCLGETAQMQARFDAGVTEEQYLGFIRGKTVALFSAAFLIAGIESGASEALLEKLEELGVCFGYVFQLRDDLLDYISEDTKEGKAVHADIKAGYYTLPLIRVLAGERGEELRSLLEQVNALDNADAAVSDILRILKEQGAFEETRERIVSYANRGLTLLAECTDGEKAGRIADILRWLAELE